MLLTPQLLAQIKDIVQKHHTALVVNAFGKDAVTSEVVSKLRASGMILPGEGSALDDAYLYGQVMAQLEDPKVADWSAEKVKDWVAKHPIALTPVEKEAAKTARLTGAQYCMGLGNTVEKETGQLLIEADHQLREELQDKISDATAANIAARETVKKLKSDLGWATKDWTRNLDRIAITEKHNAMQQGVADGIQRKGGAEARCAFRVMPDACDSCRQMYIGPDGAPRIFRLSELAPPGANIGKKKLAWVPCIGAVHPHCQCALVRIPLGWGFNEEGALVPGGKFGVEVGEITEKSFQKILRDEQQHLDALCKAQKLAGKLEFQGFPISIEQQPGDVRYWKDRNGETGKTVMLWPYGYIRGTEGVDGDHVDCYVGPSPVAKDVFIVAQRKKLPAGGFGGFDEQKCMLGFENAEQAKAAYVAHYNDPGFFGGMSQMPVEEFRKMVRDKSNHGKPIKGERVEASPEKEWRFVIDLHKSDFVSNHLESDRGHTTGSGANLVANAPPRPIGGDPTGLKAWLQEAQGVLSSRRIVRDPHVYEFWQDTPPWVMPINLHDGLMPSAQEDPNEVNKENVERIAQQVLDVDRNHSVPFTPISGKYDDGSTIIERRPEDVEELEKAGAYKYLSKKFLNGHWLYTYAQSLGGHVEDHPTNPDKFAIKVPVAAEKMLHDFKKANGISGPVLVGGQTAVLPVTGAEAAAFHAAVGGKPEKPMALKQPNAGQNKVWKTGTVAQVSGKTATFLGKNAYGKAVVQIGGGKHALDMDTLAFPPNAVAAPNPASTLPPGNVAKASQLQQDLVKSVLAEKLKKAGGSTPMDYANFLFDQGHNTYLVGGIVRDMIAGEAAGKGKDALLKEMTDVDFATTADPSILQKTHDHFSPGSAHGDSFVMEKGFIPSPTTVDLASLHNKGNDPGGGSTNAFDHDISADAHRRDFTCNAVYYDVHSNVVVDPTGIGVSDAKSKILRIVPGPEGQHDARMPLRFWKFRARGWVGAHETVTEIVGMADKALSSMTSYKRAQVMGKQIAKNNKDPKVCVAQLKKVMTEDGAGELYAKYFAPIESELLASITSTQKLLESGHG